MNKAYFSDDELMIRAWDRENIREIMSRRMYLIANEQYREELTTLWVQEKANRDTACLGLNWGYYVGFDEISNAYVVGHAQRRKDELSFLHSVRSLDKQDTVAAGTMNLQPIMTPLIEIAADGRTAKGAWFVFGLDASVRENGEAKAYWTFGRLGVDFVKESKKWKIWHLCYTTDAIVESGTAYRDQEGVVADSGLPWQKYFGEPSIPFKLHDPKLNWSDNFPPEPHEYYTMSAENSYGPEGHTESQKYLHRRGRA